MEQVYIDSNVFIYAFLADDQIGDDARKIINAVSKGKIRGYTTPLGYDETIYHLRKKLDEETFQDVVDAFLDIDFLTFLPIDKDDILVSKEYVLNGFQPRDSLHIAAWINNNIDVLVSEGSDFETIEDITALNIKKAVEMV